MAGMDIETHLVKKVAETTMVCTNCDKVIPVGQVFHHEKGVEKHLHSLIARQFCSECYAKYGADKLLSK